MATSVINRRSWLRTAGYAGLGLGLGSLRRVRDLEAAEQNVAGRPTPADVPPEDYCIQHGRIKQSVYGWCFAPMPVEQLIRACHRMGVRAMDVGKEHYPLLRELGMSVTMVGSHGFKTGPFSRDNREFCVQKLLESIDLAAANGCDKVITFTGMRDQNNSDEQGARNCVACWKQVIGHAEQKGITLCLEILNTRDGSHPMKGHPGYFGDDVERCIDLVKQVDSPRMKLLFDVYHVQVMNGDVIRRIQQYHEYIGHYHVAGVPGRGELDETQELNFPAVMGVILATGYTGFVSQEFIPTWTDKLAALRHAVRTCDI
jgi:hydroxypyruvate isomerase